MPSAPRSRPAKTAKTAKTAGRRSASAAHTKEKKKTARTTSRQEGDAASATAPAAERGSKGVPAPAAVLMQALGLPVTFPTGNTITSDGHLEATAVVAPADASGPSPAVAGMEVEVETKQGYLYSGKLALLDAHYNVLLHESLVRRARAFDYERAAREQEEQQEARLIASSLRGSSYYDAAAAAETAATSTLSTSATAHYLQLQDRLPRPRYVGTVSLRSNNVVLMRFVEPTGLPTTSAAAAATAVADSAWGRLRRSFSAMAAAIKAHLQKEKMRRRAARRARLAAKKA
ncbi:hypothetical protein ABB37_07881 [Leptomonas pyrrhocoris]|uniref:LSM domain-containing protein n=1 Tax=Leptomonas pyrrhocoris TaxID=157538 RepID=A0A0M9FUB9_LEPPY|nr:hypothetical protein ABB37_07881 [Leptomonas pyrrhocoris]KPA76109.1 hypothetical protein ABB37_07881 [Leptomonas pyrrhocoris]|eukprot:XP_015654548.1 hypothetical protein ABB37_07881 [Leptomonas pyrrhocoris]